MQPRNHSLQKKKKKNPKSPTKKIPILTRPHYKTPQNQPKISSFQLQTSNNKKKQRQEREWGRESKLV